MLGGGVRLGTAGCIRPRSGVRLGTAGCARPRGGGRRGALQNVYRDRQSVLICKHLQNRLEKRPLWNTLYRK